MYPNEKYQEYFPDAVLPEELPEAYRSCCLRIGAYAIICYVLNEYKLSQLLAGWVSEGQWSPHGSCSVSDCE